MATSHVFQRVEFKGWVGQSGGAQIHWKVMNWWVWKDPEGEILSSHSG